MTGSPTIEMAKAKPHGRPPVTTHGAIEQAAFALFDEKGFESTTLDDIAAALGIGRRTLFRYYPSKNDILWGQFDDNLRHFEAHLQNTPEHEPLGAAIRAAIIDFNRIDEDAVPQHRTRMKFLLRTPALLAHSELRYAAWRAVVSRFVAQRTVQDPTELGPSLAGRVSLAMALTAYEQWLAHPDSSLENVLNAATSGLALVFPTE